MSIQSRLDQNYKSSDPNVIQEYQDLLLLQSEQRLGKLREYLDDGFIRLVDKMGDDAAVVQAARVSYGKGTRTVSDDRALIRYLMRHRHTTPLEMVEFKFHVRIPMDAWRQMVRHRTASINEYSTRYSEAIDSQQTTGTDEWRLQATNNKQGSGGFLTEWPEGVVEGKHEHDGTINALRFANGDTYTREGWGGPKTPGDYLTMTEQQFHASARRLYDRRLEFGVAREQARKDLPLSTYTEAYWKVDLHNLFHFLGLRMDSHAQKEIRDYANAIYQLIKPHVPHCCEAFEDYRLKAMYLSGPEIAFIQGDKSVVMSKRELDELRPKLVRLGLKMPE